MRFFLCFFFLFFLIHVFGQEITFERVTTKEGLSQNDVLAIYQDSEGFMWFGTNDGLNRYDGYDFQIFRVSEDRKSSISSNLINSITEDLNRNIWISTVDAGLTRYNLQTKELKIYKNSNASPDLLLGNDVTELGLLTDGNLWGSSSFGLNFVTNPGGDPKFIMADSSETSPLNVPDIVSYYFKEVADSFALLTSRNAVFLLKKDTSNRCGWSYVREYKDDYLSDVRMIIPIQDGYLLGSLFGVLFLKLNLTNPDKYSFELLSNKNSSIMALDLKGNLWTGGPGGLNLLQPTGDKDKPFKQVAEFTEGPDNSNISNNFIRALFVDKSGIVWIGTTGGGVCKYNPMKRRFRHYLRSSKKGSISNNKVVEILEDREGNVWFGTEGGGINFLSISNSKNYKTGFIQLDVNPDNAQNFVYDILDISTSSKQKYLAGTGYFSKVVEINAIRKFSWEVSQGPVPVSNPVFAMCRDRYNTIWMATYNGGLYRYFPERKENNYQKITKKTSSLPSDIVRSLLPDSKGRLWVGTSEGLCLINKDQLTVSSPEFVRFTNSNTDTSSISHNYILPIFESSTGDIWIGTLGGGLNKYVEGTNLTNGNFFRLGLKDGLPNNVIKQIVEDANGMLWISSNKGLTRYNPITGNIRNYDIADGLQDYEFGDLSGCVLSDGEILFGGVNGFNAFYPDELSEDTIPPILVFTKLEIYNNVVEVGKEINGKVILSKSLNEIDIISLGHKENNFTIHFAGLHFSAPGSNQYKYRLKGYDSDWIIISANYRFARYTNLDKGKYVFEVMAANSDGVWVDKAKKLEIRIIPPYWRTWWFRIVLVMLITAMVVLYFLNRMKEMRMRNWELEKIVAERTKVLEQQKEQLNDKNEELIRQSEVVNETNTQLEERQQIIEEQSEELRAQKDSLEEVNATKDKFYSILAHDVKNPFNALLGYLELLKLKHAQYEPEKREKIIGIVHESAQLIYKLMQNLLDWSRSQRGLLPFNPVKLDIRQLIDQEVDIYNHIAAEKGVDVVLDYQISEFEIFADENMLKTIIRNLLANAIKYTKSGDLVKILIQKEGEDTLFSISDTGIGIPLEIIESLFRIDRHYTTEGTANEKGTGLGLILCKEFVENHGGKIWVESEEGKGSTFFFTISNKNMI